MFSVHPKLQYLCSDGKTFKLNANDYLLWNICININGCPAGYYDNRGMCEQCIGNYAMCASVHNCIIYKNEFSLHDIFCIKNVHQLHPIDEYV